MNDFTIFRELDEPECFLDRPEFKAYADKVLKVVRKGRIREAEINRALGNVHDTWTQSALKWHSDKIGDEFKGSFTWYFYRELKPIVFQRDVSIGRPSDKTLPAVESLAHRRMV